MNSESEPTDAVLLTVLESALIRLLERGLEVAAAESIARVMSAVPRCTGSRCAAPAPTAPADPSASTVIQFPARRRVRLCRND